MKRLLCAGVFCLTLAGCEHSPKPTLKDSFDLPDGTPVKCYKIERGDSTHYVYVVAGKTVSTANWTTGSGKHTSRHTSATIERE